MKQSKDSILLAEDQYPDSLDAIFTRLPVPTTLQNAITLLQWQRNACDSSYDSALKSTSITNQDYLRITYQLIPTTDNPWDNNTFRKWKYFVTNLCLSAVQEALKVTDYGKSLKYLFEPDNKEETKTELHNTKKNIKGLLLYHPILIDSPWQAPEDIDGQIGRLLQTTEPLLMARAEKEDDGKDPRDRDNAQKQMAVLHLSVKNVLERVYKLMSHSFHVLLQDLIPHARQDNSSLFTHIKGARTDHIITLRAHHNKKRDESLPELEGEALKPHSARHTLQFIEDEYVEKDDDAAHYTWSDILTATRLPKTTIFAWVDSFTLLTLRYGETCDKITKVRLTKINRVIAKQITDDEKLTIATLQASFTAVNIHNGVFTFSDLVKLLAQNVTSFTKRYSPSDHPRIMKYLKTRALRQVIMPQFASLPLKGGKGKAKRQKTSQPNQRAWSYLQEPAASLLSPGPYQTAVKPNSKGKGSKSKSKGKGKPTTSTYQNKGKGKSKGRGKGAMKGKSSMKGKGQPAYKGTSTPGIMPFRTAIGDNKNVHLKCHFCHIIGHIKPNCRKWLALQTSDQYKQRDSHETKYQLIYDHLEDSVLAPRLCQYCSDSNCDGDNCESPFDHDDYNEASVFFTQNLSALVINAKLERPLDSHAPQTEQLFMCNNDDWGDQYEDDNNTHWETQDNSEQYVETEDAYSAEAAHEEQYDEEDQNQAESDDFDEDDQDNYM